MKTNSNLILAGCALLLTLVVLELASLLPGVPPEFPRHTHVDLPSFSIKQNRLASVT